VVFMPQHWFLSPPIVFRSPGVFPMLSCECRGRLLIDFESLKAPLLGPVFPIVVSLCKIIRLAVAETPGEKTQTPV
jgi:hypothetical protein